MSGTSILKRDRDALPLRVHTQSTQRSQYHTRVSSCTHVYRLLDTRRDSLTLIQNLLQQQFYHSKTQFIPPVQITLPILSARNVFCFECGQYA